MLMKGKATQFASQFKPNCFACLPRARFTAQVDRQRATPPCAEAGGLVAPRAVGVDELIEPERRLFFVAECGHNIVGWNFQFGPLALTSYASHILDTTKLRNGRLARGVQNCGGARVGEMYTAGARDREREFPAGSLSRGFMFSIRRRCPRLPSLSPMR